MEYNEKWINDYIKNINLENIKWLNLNALELGIFFDENYYDKEVWKYVLDKNATSLYPTPLGMYYLNLNNPMNLKKHNFFLGVVNNNIGKQTIVSAITYLDNYYLFNNQEPLTYLITTEVSSYFRNQGIYKQMCMALFDYINYNQHILITQTSQLGEKCKVYEILKQTAIIKNFKNYILEDKGRPYELFNIISSKNKVLKK